MGVNLSGMNKWCYCGRRLEDKFGILTCPTHKQEWEEPKRRKKIGRWSGTTKRMKGAYDKY